MTLRNVVDKLIGVRTRVEMKTYQIGAPMTAEEVLPNDASRLGWLVINLSTEDIYIGFDKSINSNMGILVGKLGGSVSAVVTEDYDLVGWAVYGYAATGGCWLHAVVVKEL